MSNISRSTVRESLVETARTEPVSLRACEIASDLDGFPKAVAQYLSQFQDELTIVSLEQWGRSKRTTWRLEVNES